MTHNAALEPLENRTLFAAALPAGFTDTPLATGLTAATGLALLPDGRMLVTRKDGTLDLVSQTPGAATTTALQLGVDSSTERGLLGVAVDPKFTTNHYVYLYYFAKSRGYGQVGRFVLNGDTVDPSSQLVVLQMTKQLNGGQHCGGAIQFGPDGKLYIAVGDNEAVGDDPTTAASEDLTSTSGKLLRINSNGGIPTDNPYYGKLSGVLRSIYATGLRNPFTMGVDAVNGTMYVNDVGSNQYEEIDLVRKGADYGWPNSEGPNVGPGVDAPVYNYPPPVPGGGSCIIGGAFYDGVTQQFPAEYAGKYFFGDYRLGTISTFDPATGQATPFASGFGQIIDFDAAADGTLLVTTYDGTVHAITYSETPVQPPPDQPPAPPTIPPLPTGTASITGYVVNDVNQNGKWDSGEKGIAGRTVFIDQNNNGTLDAGEVSQVTASNGKYAFTGLGAGTYRILNVLPSGVTQTSPVGGGYSTKIKDGTATGGRDFLVTGTPTTPPSGGTGTGTGSGTGGTETGDSGTGASGTAGSGTSGGAPTGTASIQAYVVNDTNGDGKWTSGEVGITGRTVWIDTDDDGILDPGEQTATTGPNGKFAFTGLAAGTYHLREVVPAGSRQTSPAANGAITITLSTGQAKSGNSFQVVGA